MNRTGRLVTTAIALLLLGPGLLAGGSAGAATDHIDPATLPRGADLGRPYVEGTTIVDSVHQRVVDVRGARQLEILDVARTGYLVSKRRSFLDVALVSHDGSQRRLPLADEDTLLRPDGRFYVVSSLLSDGETQVAVRRTRDGKPVATHVFRSWVDPGVGRFVRAHDLQGSRVLLGGSGGRAMVWTWTRDTLRTVRATGWRVQSGSLLHGVAAASLTAGRRCTVVARLSRPGHPLWRSCGERVLSFSPSGRRMVTVDRSAGPAKVQRVTLRKVDGRVLGRWRAEGFTDIAWESGKMISFRVRGSSQTAMVRCSASQCANASDPAPLDQP